MMHQPLWKSQRTETDIGDDEEQDKAEDKNKAYLACIALYWWLTYL